MNILFAIVERAGPGSVDNQTYVLRSNNLGATWFTVSLVGTLTTGGFEKCFHGSALIDLYICFGLSGVYRSTDQGLTWTQVIVPTNNAIYNAVWSRTTTDTWVGGFQNAAAPFLPFVQHYTGTWGIKTNLPLPVGVTSAQVVSIFALDANIIWVVGNRTAGIGGGIIWKTVDGGANWTIDHHRVTSFFHSIWAFNANDAWVSGDYDLAGTNVALHYTGIWVNTPPPSGFNPPFGATNQNLWGIGGVSSNDLWALCQDASRAAHYNGAVWSYTDTGVPYGGGGQIRHLWVIDTTHVYGGMRAGPSVGARANIEQWNGANWVDLPSEFSTNLNYTNPATTAGIVGIIPPISTRESSISGIFVVAEDVIEVDFSEDIIVDSNLFNSNNYVIEDVSTGAIVYINRVLSPKTIASDKIYLIVKGLQLGLTYKLTITDLKFYDRNGLLLIFNDVNWLMRRTKVDSTLNSLANLYDTRSRSNIRGLLEAVMISDEKIGGDY